MIAEQFQPDPWVLCAARQYGCHQASGDREREERVNFICYHRSHGNQRYDWNAEYLRWLLRGKQYDAVQCEKQTQYIQKEEKNDGQFVQKKQPASAHRCNQYGSDCKSAVQRSVVEQVLAANAELLNPKR